MSEPAPVGGPAAAAGRRDAGEPVEQLATDDVCRVVGERVRDLRIGLGLTMERFAEAAGLSLGMLSKIENGQTSPSLNTLTGLANAAGVPLTAFFRGLDEEHDAVGRASRGGSGDRPPGLGGGPPLPGPGAH